MFIIHVKSGVEHSLDRNEALSDKFMTFLRDTSMTSHLDKGKIRSGYNKSQKH